MVHRPLVDPRQRSQAHGFQSVATSILMAIRERNVVPEANSVVFSFRRPAIERQHIYFFLDIRETGVSKLLTCLWIVCNASTYCTCRSNKMLVPCFQGTVT